MPGGPTLLAWGARYSRRSARAAVRALYALADELQTILITAGTPAIRRLKIAFWQEEIAQARRGRAQHPLARTLAAVVPAPTLHDPAIDRALADAACEAALDGPFPAVSWPSWVAGTVGEIVALGGACEHPHLRPGTAHGRAAGAAYAFTCRLQTLGASYRHRPWELASLAALDPAAATQGDVPAATAVLRGLAREAYREAQSATADATPSTRVLAALGRRLLAELEAEITTDPGALLDHQLFLPGPRIYWLALRARLRL